MKKEKKTIGYLLHTPHNGKKKKEGGKVISFVKGLKARNAGVKIETETC